LPSNAPIVPRIFPLGPRFHSAAGEVKAADRGE
jgi:hypothetical protein